MLGLCFMGYGVQGTGYGAWDMGYGTRDMGYGICNMMGYGIGWGMGYDAVWEMMGYDVWDMGMICFSDHATADQDAPAKPYPPSNPHPIPIVSPDHKTALASILTETQA